MGSDVSAALGLRFQGDWARGEWFSWQAVLLVTQLELVVMVVAVVVGSCGRWAWQWCERQTQQFCSSTG